MALMQTSRINLATKQTLILFKVAKFQLICNVLDNTVARNFRQLFNFIYFLLHLRMILRNDAATKSVLKLVKFCHLSSNLQLARSLIFPTWAENLAMAQPDDVITTVVIKQSW